MVKEKIHSLTERIKPTLRRTTEFLFERKPTFRGRLLVPVIIKYLYIILTITLLTHRGYVGEMNYGVNFNIWKELLATAVFIPVTYVQAKLPVPDRFMQLLMRFLFILYYVPLNSAFALNNKSFGFFFFSNLYFFLCVP